MVLKITAVVCALCCIAAVSFAAKDAAIGSLFDGKRVVNVYVDKVVNESGEREISADAYRKSLEKSLTERKSMHFNVVTERAASDISVAAVITDYQYLERGPFHPTPGIGTTLLDAAATATANYVDMTVEYTVTDTASGEVLWHDTLTRHLKKVMTPAESVPLIFDQASRFFIWKCFGSPHEGQVITQPM